MIAFYAEETQLPAVRQEAVREWVRTVARSYGKKVGDISYIFCSDEKILAVNREFLRDERTEELLTQDHFDYVVDAIDSLSPKVFLLHCAYTHQIPIVSSMGAGAKTDPSQVRIADISKSINCTLARAVRKRLHALGIRKGIPVVFSTEFADMNAVIEVENESNKRTTAGTVAYMPAIFGCYLAAHVLKNMV